MSRAGSQITCTRQDVAFALRLVQLLASAQAELCHSETRLTDTLTTTRVYDAPRGAAPGAPQSPSCAGISIKYFNVVVDDATHLTPKMLPPEGVAQS